MVERFVDPYLDHETGLLRNVLNIKNDDELKLAEADLVYAREMIIEDASIPRTNDATELLSIHKFLFGDIYEWAGTIRNVDIAKRDDKDNFFLIKSRILTGLDYVFDELREEDGLKGLGFDDLIRKLTYFYEQLNFIHPFREGNGRTQRVFWNRVAKDAGYEINWKEVVGDENDIACRVALKNQDLTLLVKMFSRIVEKV